MVGTYIQSDRKSTPMIWRNTTPRRDFELSARKAVAERRRVCVRNLDYAVKKDEIFSSLMAAKQVIRKLNLKPFLILADEAKEDFLDIESVDNENIEANSLNYRAASIEAQLVRV